jgi:hypothetical protein
MKPERQAPKPTKSVLQWLLDSDPSIRGQVLRDLSDEPAEVVAAERSRVALEGWGAWLLGEQRPDGRSLRSFWRRSSDGYYRAQ